jgi:hypothetical protein
MTTNEEMRMRKIIATGAVALMAFGGGSVALASHSGPPFGPDGIDEGHPAWYGLCTAWFNNSDQGKQNGAPFQALSEHFDGDEDAIAEWCSGLRPGNGHGNGGDNSNAPAPGPRGNG